MKSLYFRSSSSQLFSYDLPSDTVQEQSLEDLKEQIFDFLGIPLQEQALFYNGRLIHNLSGLETLHSGSVIDVNLRLDGGKGGFGSLLRGQAVSKRKITNFDASRDLQGRRIRNVKLHQKLMEWARKKKQDDKAIQKEVDAYNKQQKDLQGVQRDIRLTQEFKDKVEKWDNEMSASIRAGAKKAKQAVNNKERRDFELDDFAEPQKKKIIVTESLQTEVIKGKEEAECKISQKLQALLQNNNTSEEKTVTEEIIVEKVIPVEEKKEESKPETNGFAPIELTEIKSLEELVNLGADHLKHELMRLGLKCGGSLQDRAKRLYDIKLKPELLFNPKYIAKK
jgi:hypothetical protein